MIAKRQQHKRDRTTMEARLTKQQTEKKLVDAHVELKAIQEEEIRAQKEEEEKERETLDLLEAAAAEEPVLQAEQERPISVRSSNRSSQ